MSCNLRQVNIVPIWHEGQRESLGGKFGRRIIVDIDKLQSYFVQHGLSIKD